jgi:hypothetical protein
VAQQQREQGPLPRPAHPHQLPADPDFERPEDAELKVCAHINPPGQYPPNHPPVARSAARTGIEAFLKHRRGRLAAMLYAAKCYWPGVTEADLGEIAGRAARTRLLAGRGRAGYLGSLLFAADDLVLCLFQGPSRAAVIQASGRLAISCERIMDAAWLGPCPATWDGTRS